MYCGRRKRRSSTGVCVCVCVCVCPCVLDNLLSTAGRDVWLVKELLKRRKMVSGYLVNFCVLLYDCLPSPTTHNTHTHTVSSDDDVEWYKQEVGEEPDPGNYSCDLVCASHESCDLVHASHDSHVTWCMHHMTHVTCACIT